MSDARFFRIRESNKDIDVGSLQEAALRWEAIQTIWKFSKPHSIRLAGDDARTPVKKFEPEELTEVLRSSRM